ncbi:hypothetical protein PLICRDRAFT_53615 [Plicaturopsis crispa FD-325 SS-3]|nr:hypothetical protein PLICRDRAFT_53615 [Plicaturopsis crispa FD-325 SS-3]
MSANIRDLNEGRAQALQGLLSSLSIAESGGPKIKPEQLRELSETLGQLVGDVESDGPTQRRNERGELVNEDGLPIFDISEPLPNGEPAQPSEPELALDDTDIVPLTSLPTAERERRRLERERLLDLLEEEERAEQAKIAAAESQQRQDALQKRKEAAKGEMDKLKAAKEMQKKMGKALLQNMAKARDQEEKAKKDALAQDHAIEEQRRTLKPRKSVSFVADLPEGGGEPKAKSKIREKEVNLDWGDVTPARLRPSKTATPATRAQIERNPMKMDVVERTPAPLSTEQPFIENRDSDDESAPGSPVPADSDEGEAIHSDLDEDEPHNHVPNSESDGDEDTEDEQILEEEFDLDTAQHQREIALEYYNKRSTVGSDASKAMTSHTHHEEEDEWDQPEVPLEATLSGSQPKPSVSRFKANRIAAAYNATTPSSSTSLGTSVLPASNYQTVKKAIRTGKLENDQLVVPADESGSDIDDDAKEILELLKKGEIHNIGPDASSLTPKVVSPLPSIAVSAPPEPEVHSPAVPTAPKTSRFKATRQERHVSPSPSSSRPSPPSTPISTATRSSPKLPSNSLPTSPANGTASSPIAGLQMPSMIVESPSFARPKFPVKAATPHGSTPLAPTLASVDSTSSQPPSSISSTPTVVGSPISPAINSPSFASPRSTESMSRRPDRPPMVMSTAVRESMPGRAEEPPKERRMSRFLAERM